MNTLNMSLQNSKIVLDFNTTLYYPISSGYLECCINTFQNPGVSPSTNKSFMLILAIEG